MDPFVRRCEAAWPGLNVSRAGFIAWLVERQAQLASKSLERPHATDLFLVYGCISGDPASLRAFEERILCQIDPYVRRLGRSTSFVDDVRQELRTRLFVVEGRDEPRIAAYRGDGPLAAWVRAIAVRTALNSARGKREPDPEALDVAASDPELEYVRATYAREFRSALEAVLMSRPPEERDILRMHYLEARNIEDVGATLGVHRATIARRLLRIRDVVLRDTSERVRSRLGLDHEELDALLGSASREMDVSLARILARSR